MHDLRRRALLESGKTQSRKARTKQASATSSRAGSTPNSASNSRPGSRVASTQPSDEEDFFSDTTSLSDVTSLNDGLHDLRIDETLEEIPGQTWEPELQDRVEEIIDGRTKNMQQREECLKVYCNLLMAHYAREEIFAFLGDLVPALLKVVRAGRSDDEVVLGMRALALTIITDPHEASQGDPSTVIKRVIHDAESDSVMVAGIHLLGVAHFFCESLDEETEELMDYFADIAASEGNAVGAEDSAPVITAALEQWGFLATEMEEMDDLPRETVEAVIEQLDLPDTGVQIAAGENLALLYEKSWTPLEDDERVGRVDHGGPELPVETDDVKETHQGITYIRNEFDPDEIMVKRYTVHHREDELKHKLHAIANLSSKRLSRHDRKRLHSAFTDILNTVNNPTLGPGYRRSISQETGKSHGCGITVRIGRVGVIHVDRWWKLHRLKALRRILQGGLHIHYQHNPLLMETVPFEGHIVDDGADDPGASNKSKDRYRMKNKSSDKAKHKNQRGLRYGAHLAPDDL